jgi:hypothetical protein
LVPIHLFFKLLRGLKILRLNLPAVDQESQSTLQNRARDQWLARQVFGDRYGCIDQHRSILVAALLREIFFSVLFADFCSSENLSQGPLELLTLVNAEYKFSVLSAGYHLISPSLLCSFKISELLLLLIDLQVFGGRCSAWMLLV